MALSDKTFADAGGAVTDLFNAYGATQNASLKARGLNLEAQGTRLKAQGDLAEGQEYDLAASLARQNEQFAATSTAIQEAQQARQTSMQIGGQRADIAGAGFAESGSGLDILADSARQGALAQAVLGTQGLINEAGYEEQAKSYDLMANTARTTAAGEESIAAQTDEIANETKAAGQTAMFGDIAGGLLKGAATVATLAL